MADNERVVVGCSGGEENPDAVAVSYLTAGAALDQGREVVLWLTSEGVRLGLQGYAESIRTDKDPPAARLHQQLLENAELKGASPLMGFPAPGTVTFTY